MTVVSIYKHRLKIDLVFRWIKQHLRLRGFLSIDSNGVRVQIWTALCAYLLVAIAKRAKHPREICIRFCTLSQSPHWRNVLRQRYLREMMRGMIRLIRPSNWLSTGSDPPAVTHPRTIQIFNPTSPNFICNKSHHSNNGNIAIEYRFLVQLNMIPKSTKA